MTMFSITWEVGSPDIEPVYNHVHHAHSIRLMEEARRRYLEALGCPLESFIEQGLFLVITNIEVSYRREVLRGPVTITVEEPRISGRRVSVSQRIINARGKDAVLAAVHFAFMSGETKRAVEPPPEFSRIFVGGTGGSAGPNSSI